MTKSRDRLAGETRSTDGLRGDDAVMYIGRESRELVFRAALAQDAVWDHVRLAGPPRDRLASRVDLFDDGVVSDHGYDSRTNSTGVQMIAGSKPAPRQMASILRRTVALAMWVQFHVSR